MKFKGIRKVASETKILAGVSGYHVRIMYNIKDDEMYGVFEPETTWVRCGQDEIILYATRPMTMNEIKRALEQ